MDTRMNNSSMEERRRLLLERAKPAVVAPESGVADIPEVVAPAGNAEAKKPKDARKPRVVDNSHLKGFRLRAGDRPIILDRKAVSFACPELGRPGNTVIGLKLLGARPVVVTTPYDEVVQWWLGDAAPPIPPPAAKPGSADQEATSSEAATKKQIT